MWTNKELIGLSPELAIKLATLAYKAGDKERAIELGLDAAKAFKSETSIFGGLSRHEVSDFKKTLIDAGDLVAVESLQKLFVGMTGRATERGSGVCASVVANKLDILQTLLGDSVDNMMASEVERSQPKEFAALTVAKEEARKRNFGDAYGYHGNLSNGNYDSKSAYFWAAVLNRTEALEILIAKNPEFPFVKLVHEQNKGPKGGYRSGTTSREVENILSAVVEYGREDVIRLLFEDSHQKARIKSELSKMVTSGSQHMKTNQLLALAWMRAIPEKDMEQWWSEWESETIDDWSGYKKTPRRMTHMLMKSSTWREVLQLHFPSKFLSLVKEIGTEMTWLGSHHEWERILTNAPMETVMAVENTQSPKMFETWSPSSNARIKRVRGPLACLIEQGCGDMAKIEVYSSRPEVWENDFVLLEESMSKGWLAPEGRELWEKVKLHKVIKEQMPVTNKTTKRKPKDVL